MSDMCGVSATCEGGRTEGARRAHVLVGESGVASGAGDVRSFGCGQGRRWLRRGPCKALLSALLETVDIGDVGGGRSDGLNWIGTRPSAVVGARCVAIFLRCLATSRNGTVQGLCGVPPVSVASVASRGCRGRGEPCHILVVGYGWWCWTLSRSGSGGDLKATAYQAASLSRPLPTAAIETFRIREDITQRRPRVRWAAFDLP
eukprot:TRINITY_DN33533_c0_g1_i1.p2 TRINITY_DN33533_c0_g1~~TRINITY_DN33533_c0_g1_i1.p2  ORF type:complete len:203 (+),score=17.59 TRINITY_DN33533_c0_g1_i1:77-685(+)